jgi:hypothetical protein
VELVLLAALDLDELDKLELVTEGADELDLLELTELTEPTELVELTELADPDLSTLNQFKLNPPVRTFIPNLCLPAERITTINNISSCFIDAKTTTAILTCYSIT